MLIFLESIILEIAEFLEINMKYLAIFQHTFTSNNNLSIL